MLKSNLLSMRTVRDDMRFTSGAFGMIRFSLAMFVFLGTCRLAVGDIKVIEIGDRRVNVQVPPSYDPGVPAPLLLELHGGAGPQSLLGFRAAARDAGFLYAAPTGGTSECFPDLPPGWNPKFTYCEQWSNCPDDSAYLREVIESTMLQLAVDPQRIYIAGRSLGAMMTLRMACDHADVLAGIVCFDAAWPREEQRASCMPSAPVHALHIYGTAFGLPEGETFMKPCPDTPLFHIGGAGVADEWAGYNGSSLETEEGLPLDLVTTLPGEDTLVTRYTECEPGGQVELWTILGAGHRPSWTDEFYTTVLDWLFRHPKGSVSIPPIEVDFNGDYKIDIEDLIILIEHWGQNEPSVDIAPAPFGDGVVDAADLEALMSHWAQEVYDPSFIAHWKLDETEGMFAAETVSDNNELVIGGPAWQPEGGQVDGALEFDGIDDMIVAKPVLNPADGPFSAFAWIKGGAPGQVILSQAGGENWLLTDDTLGSLKTDLKGKGRDWGPSLHSDRVIKDGHWHRIGLVWDGLYRSLYVDDEIVATDVVPQDNFPSSQGGLIIGAANDHHSGAFWSGMIDDVRIYNRVVKP